MKPFFWVCAALCLAGCGGNSDETTLQPAKPTAAQEKAALEMKTSREKFAFALKDQLIKAHPSENVCYSPLSIQLCLSMLLNGTAGDSTTQLRTALALDKETLDLVNDGSYALVSALSGDSFTSANSIWLQGDLQAKPEFLRTIQDAYGGEFFTIRDAGADTVKRINDWTSEKTKKRIPELFKELDARTCLVLVNALTFDGKWVDPFPKDLTKPAPFKLADGKSVEVPTMHQKEHFGYSEAKGVKTLRLDYTGEKYSMVFVLPPPDQTASGYLAKLNAADFTKGLAGVINREVDVALPKFELRSNYSLKEALSAMGMADLFVHIDLSRVTDALKTEAFISQVVHQTYMKVHEEGTEAAAATGAAVGVTSAPAPSEPLTFHADRPFVYALMDNATGAIVFLGVVNDPKG